MAPESSLLHSQVHATFPCLEPVQSSLYAPRPDLYHNNVYNILSPTLSFIPQYVRRFLFFPHFLYTNPLSVPLDMDLRVSMFLHLHPV